MSNKTLPCGCGCGQSGAPNQMTIVRTRFQLGGEARFGRQSWTVRKSCQEAFETELMHRHTLQRFVEEHAGAGFLQRLWLMPQIYDLQFAVHQRVKGKEEAKRLARQAAKLWLLPRWLAVRKAWKLRGANGALSGGGQRPPSAPAAGWAATGPEAELSTKPKD